MAWWRRQPWTAPESVPAKVKYECVPGLGSPDIGSCENVSFEMLGSEEIVLEPANKPFINVVGMSIFCYTNTIQLSFENANSLFVVRLLYVMGWAPYHNLK